MLNITWSGSSCEGGGKGQPGNVLVPGQRPDGETLSGTINMLCSDRYTDIGRHLSEHLARYCRLGGPRALTSERVYLCS